MNKSELIEAATDIPIAQEESDRLAPQVADLAIQYRYQTLDYLLAPMLSLSIDQASKLCDGDRYPNAVQLADKFRHGWNAALFHQDSHAPHNGAPA
jgi:hypothetical protein